MRKTNNKQLLKIGATVFAALLLFYFGFNFLKGLNIFDKNNTYYVSFNRAPGVQQSTPVYIDGFYVGLVRKVSYDYSGLDGIDVELALDKELKIPRGSQIVVSSNPLSGAQLDILKNSNTSVFYQPNDTILSYSKADLISQVSDDILPSMAAMVNTMDTLLMGIDRIINNKYIFNTFEEISRTAQNLRYSSETLHGIFTQNLPIIVDNVEKSTSSLNSITAKFDQLRFEKALSEIESTATNVRTLTTQLNNPNSSFGLLLHDRSLYDKINTTVGSADSLLVDLRKNPKRYVTFTLF